MKTTGASLTLRDPVCGMTVDPNALLTAAASVEQQSEHIDMVLAPDGR